MIQLAIFALLTLYARPYLGMHFPLDVLAGAALGAVVGLLARCALGRWEAAVASQPGPAPGAGEVRVPPPGNGGGNPVGGAP